MEPRDNAQSKDRLDQWLDTALQEYGSAEPRMGLESRILANLAAEKASFGARRRRWLWVFGAAAAMTAVVIVVWLGSGTSTRSRSSGNFEGNATSTTQKASEGNARSEVEQSVKATVQRRRPHFTKATEAPRLSQFPSPQPLSEQEQMLVRYVTESPNEAVLIAQQQADWQKELERLSADESSKTDSDQQER